MRKLSQEAVQATRNENAGILPCRCRFKITNVKGQDTCELPLTADEQTAQLRAMGDSPLQSLFCRAHANLSRLRQMNINPNDIFDGSDAMFAYGKPSTP